MVVEALLEADFNVTILTRKGSSIAAGSIPAGVSAIKHVDYKSVDSLKAALVGQDAVVSALGTSVSSEQMPLAEAAVAPGSSIQRFIPSEFGINTRKTPGTAIEKMLGPKTRLVDFLDKAAAANPAFTWTALSTGLFFDWGLPRGLMDFDADTRTATIYDSGNARFGATNIGFIGRAVVAVLKAANDASSSSSSSSSTTPAGDKSQDKTANRYLEIASLFTTQNEVLAAAQALTPGETWTVTHVSSAEKQVEAEALMAKGETYAATLLLLFLWQYADGTDHAPDPTDPAFGNTVLGLEMEDPKVGIAAWLKK